MRLIPDTSVKDIRRAIPEVKENPSYRQTARKLQRQIMGQEGAETVICPVPPLFEQDRPASQLGLEAVFLRLWIGVPSLTPFYRYFSFLIAVFLDRDDHWDESLTVAAYWDPRNRRHTHQHRRAPRFDLSLGRL